MVKEDPGVSKSQAWGCAQNPQEIFKETQASKLGDAPCIPFFINNHQFVPRCTIFLSLHVLCAMLGASRSLIFLGCFCFVCWSLQCRNLTCLIGRETRSA